MKVLCIDTGTLQSGLVLVDSLLGMPYSEIEYAKIIKNEFLFDVIDEIKPDLCIIEMITIFGGRRKSSHISESIIIIGIVMRICEQLVIPCQRISRAQVVSYFLKNKKSDADAKIGVIMRQKLGLHEKQRHALLKYDLWQAFALFQFAFEHNFDKWYVPNLKVAKNALKTPENKAARIQKQKKYHEREITKHRHALDQLTLL